MIDTPHAGAGAASYVANTQDLFPYYYGVSAASLALTFYYSWLGQDQLAKFYGVMFGYTFVTSGVNSAVRAALNRYKTPALMDMLPDSAFIKDINSASFGGIAPPKQYLIAGRGVPVPLSVTQGGAFAMGVNPITLMMASTANLFANPKLDTFEGRFLGSYLTMITGYPIFEDGDLIVEKESQLGEGVSSLSNAKRFTHTLRSPSLGIIENAIAPGLDSVFNFLSPPVKAMAYIALGLSIANAVAVDENANSIEFIGAHLTMKDKTVLEDNALLLDQTLFDNPFVGSSRIGSVNAQGLVLLSGEATPVEVKGYGYTKASVAALPIVVDEQEKQIESITVTEPPTKISGVLRDFMPQRMQYFQYSENFAAWKDVTVKDEWGNFEIDG
ncbi:MAG: hypothetical protein KJ811_02305, partial [Candidatus Margulisbacteria bacterium]|nr:hypothetical protein [Candidatus Margulisiibacteriota bacterium]